MQVTVSAKSLADALTAGVHTNSPLPITRFCLISADPAGEVKLTTFSGGELYYCVIDGQVRSQGQLCAPAGALLDLVKGRDCDVQLAAQDEWLIVRCGRSRFKLPTIPADSFPEDNWTESVEIPIEPLTLAAMIERVLPFGARDDKRPFMNMVNVGNGQVVTANAWSLAIGAIDYDDEPFQVRTVDADLLRKHLKPGSKLLMGKREKIAHRLIVQSEREQLSLAFHHERTPDWNQATNAAEKDRYVAVQASDFADAIQRCLAAVDAVEKDKYPSVGLAINDGVLEVSAIRARQIDSDFAMEPLDIVDSNGDIKDLPPVVLNVRMLSQVLRLLKGSTVRWFIADPSTIQTFTAPDEGAAYYMMPVKL